MGSSISKYEDLELSTAEGGLEPLPTSKKSKQFCRNCNNKTQCQLCKRLVGPINPFSWSGLVWKRVSPLDLIIGAQSTAMFLCI